MTVFFDVETAPASNAEIAPFTPAITAPTNYKDEAKIAKYVEDGLTEWRSKLALSPLTGRVLAIGWMDERMHIFNSTERSILNTFWQMVEFMDPSSKIAGWNIFGFDLPMLVQRSWKHGLKIPGCIRAGRYWNPAIFLDVREQWGFGNRYADGTLDQVARFLGLPGKTGTGADFAKLWETDRPAAEAYLYRDLELVRDVWQRIQI